MYPNSNGLGFPIVLPIALAVGSLVGGKLLKKKPKVTEADAKNAVQQVYLELFGRDPWSPYDRGAEGYVKCLVEGWCDIDFVRTELLKSQEYRDVQTRKAQAVFAPAATGAPVLSLPGGLDVGGILPYALGGILLFSLLKR